MCLCRDIKLRSSEKEKIVCASIKAVSMLIEISLEWGGRLKVQWTRDNRLRSESLIRVTSVLSLSIGAEIAEIAKLVLLLSSMKMRQEISPDNWKNFSLAWHSRVSRRLRRQVSVSSRMSSPLRLETSTSASSPCRYTFSPFGFEYLSEFKYFRDPSTGLLRSWSTRESERATKRNIGIRGESC